MKLEVFSFSALLGVAVVVAWPGMQPKKTGAEDYIGPACTVGKLHASYTFQSGVIKMKNSM